MLKIGWCKKQVSSEGFLVIAGQSFLRVSKKILDPLTVTALTVYGDDDYFIFLSCDLINIQQGILNAIRKRVEEKNPEIDTMKIVMHVTHTHCGPFLSMDDSLGQWKSLDELPHDEIDIIPPKEYTMYFINTAADAIVESFENKQEGSFSYGYGYAVVAHSRRVVYFDDISKRDGQPGSFTIDGHAKMYGNTNHDMFSHYEAGSDHFANFMFTFDKNEKLTGAIVNIPCPSQNSELDWMLSADYWNEVRNGIKEKYGDIFILPQCAAAGDLSPRLLHYKAAQSRRYRLKYADYEVKENVMEPEEILNRLDIGERICQAFDEVYAWASKEKFSNVPIVHSVKTVELDKRMITDEEYQRCCEEKEKCKVHEPFVTEGYNPFKKLQINSKILATMSRYDGILDRYKKQKTEPRHQMEMHVIKLGDIAFATNQFELYMDYQHRIQARSPFTQTFVVQLTAQPDKRAGSYLATERGAWGAGYGASMFTNQVSPQGGQQLVEETVKELKRIY